MGTSTIANQPPNTLGERAGVLRQEVRLIPAPAGDAAATAMARRGILLCQAGQPVARVMEVPADASAGNPGPADLRVGRFVKWDDEAGVYVATTSGHVWLQRGRLEVEDTLEIAEDIDGSTGAVHFAGQLTAQRSILDSAQVLAGGTITVNGAVEAAEVRAEGDVHVHHGICGKERGLVAAGGRFTARFITNARATSGGDMVIANEIINSQVTCGGLLKAENGTILAGHIISLGGIHCHTAGSEAGTRTILEAGLAPERYGEIQKIVSAAEASLQRVRDIRAKVQPLMAHAKNLTAAQKEKATELLYAADEAEAHAHRDLQALAQSKDMLRTALGARILVSSLLYPGVIIRYPVAEGIVMTRLRGPVEIAVQMHGSNAEVVVVDRCRNTAVPLPGVPGAETRTDFARRFLVGPAPAL
jgi:uncharacterized protein